ncbi:MAG: DNA polymerase III subunit delta' [Selenomonadaceae bacterium]|nr:DNA polymerase III subunit delta' [Selenomonadaceae bacterium]
MLSWENLIGHAATIDYLKKNIAEEKFPHAVIFSGEEGVGKRLAAEICAAALLCENPIDGNPCGSCESCHLVAAKSHPDFYVVEAEETKTARNIKIGQIREMQAEASLIPINSARRVIIIDGAELMNKAAANCLLKTIEEPPSQTIFILLTTSRSSLLMTIRSRCMTINFDKLTASQIRDALISREVDAQEAERLAVIAGGSFGRALKLKDSGGIQIRETALDTLEKISRKEFSNEEIFKTGAEMSDWSRDKFSDFLTHVQKILRDICFAEILEPYNPDVAERLSKIKIPERKIFLMIEAGAEFHKRLKSNANLRLLAEAYLMKVKKIYQRGWQCGSIN